MSEDQGSVSTGNPEATEASTPAPVIEASETVSSGPDTGWFDSIQDADMRNWATSKGLQNGSYENVLGSYRNLEKLMGADKAGRTVTLLGDDATDAQRNEFYGKLGRPETAADYGLAPPEGQNGDFAEWASNVFHGVGLSKVQAEKVAEAWDGMQATQRQETVTKAEVSSADAVATLKKEWGAAYDQKVAGVEVAAGKLGLTEDHLGGLRSALGPVEAMKFIDMLNGKMGDHNYDSGEPVVSGAMTPEQAKTELNALSSNGEFMTAWLSRSHPGHKDAVAKKSALARQVSGIEA